MRCPLSYISRFPCNLFSFHAFIRSFLHWILVDFKNHRGFKTCLLFASSPYPEPDFVSNAFDRQAIAKHSKSSQGKYFFIFFFKCQSFKTFLDAMMFFSNIHLIKLTSTKEAQCLTKSMFSILRQNFQYAVQTYNLEELSKTQMTKKCQHQPQ